MKKKFTLLLVALAAVFGLQAQVSTCAKPSSLTASVETDGWGTATLQWERPADPSSYAFGYANSATSGLSYNSHDYVAVIRLTADELATYQGKYLRAVQFVPYGFADFTVMIWKGGSFNPSDSSFSPGALIYNKPVTKPLDYITTSTIELDTAITVDTTQELWIGIRAVYDEGNYPISYATGNCEIFKSNITYFPNSDSWALMYSTADGVPVFDRSWVILGVFSDAPHVVTGYELYRNSTLIATLSADQQSYIDTITPGTYQYGVSAKYDDNCTSPAATATAILKNMNCSLSVPYFTSFEEAVATTATTGNNNLPDCWKFWNKGGSSYTNHPAVFSASGYASSGNNYIQFYTSRYVNYANQHAILPPVDNVTLHVNQLKLSFEARSYNNDNKGILEVGVMSDYTDASTYELIDTINVNTLTYEPYVVDLSGYQGNGQYITIRCPRPATSGTYTRILVDNVGVNYATACDAPTNLDTVSVTENSIGLTWENNCSNASSYVITCSNGQEYTSTTTGATITGLNPSTTYTFTVHSVDAADMVSMESLALTVSTACGALTTMPFAENFDSYPGSTTGTTNNLPACWDYTNTGTYASYSGYPILYNSSTYASSGSNTLRFYTNSSNYGLQTAILPAIDTTVFPLNTLTMTFKARRYLSSYSANLEVGVMHDSVFTLVGTASPQSTTYESFTISFSGYTGSGNRIAIRLQQPSSSYAAAHVDDLKITAQNSCATPGNFTVHHITSNSCVVSWNGVAAAASYEVALVPEGTQLANVTPIQVNDTMLTLSGLTTSMNYTVYLRSVCDAGVTGYWSDGIAFRTKCEAVAVPFVDNFDSYTALTATSTTTPGMMPDCWTRVNSNTVPYPYVYSTQHYSGTASLYLYTNTTTDAYCAAVTPALDLSEHEAGTLEITFKMLKTNAYYGRLDVGITDHFDNDADLNNITVLRSIYPHEMENTGQWYTFKVRLTHAYDQPQYIVLNVPIGSSINAACIDDFSVDAVSPCDAPASVSMSAVAATSAKVNWTPTSNAMSYAVTYGVVGGNSTTVNVEASERTLLLTGLTPSSTYNVTVEAQCGSGNSAAATSFHTLCFGMDEVAVGAGTTTSYYVPAYTAYKNSFSQQIYTASEIGGAMDISSLAFEFSGTVSTTQDIRIYLAHTYYNNMTEAGGWIPMLGAQCVYTGTVTWEHGWNYIALDTPFPYNGLENLVVMMDNSTLAGNGTTTTNKNFRTHATSSVPMARYVYNSAAASVNTDINPYNITVAGTTLTSRNNIRFGSCDASVNCVAPNLFATENGTSVELNWAPGNDEASWVVEHKISNASTWTNDGTVTVTHFTLENLLSNTSYDVRVGVVCGDNTEWATATVSTHCNSAQLPLTENFDNATGTTANDFIPCWYRGTNNTTNICYAYSTYNTSAPYSMRVYGSSTYYAYIASPRLADDIEMDSLQIKFNMYAANSSYPLMVGIMSDPNDYTTFEPLKTVYQPANALSTFALQEVSTKGYTGNGRYIALMGPQWRTETIYVDDIVIDYLVPCAHVTDFQITDIQSTQAQITWQPGSSETVWEYILTESDSLDPESDVPVTTEQNMVTLTGLQSNTTYNLFVKSVCDAESESEYFPFTFTTECPPITVPYLESFDTYGTGSNAYPDCWNRLYTTSKPYITTTNYSAPGSLYMLSASTGYNMAIFPRLADDINVNTLQLRCQYRGSSSTAPNLYVGVMTNPTDESTFVPIDTLVNTTSSFSSYVVNFDQYQGTGKYIAFLNNTNSVRYIDDIILDIMPACENTSVCTAGAITANSITVDWTSGSEASGYQIMLLPAGTPYTEGTPATVTGTTYTFSDLTPNTPYDFYMSWICNGGSSNTIALTGLRTECDLQLTLPYFENFDSYSTGTTVSPDCWKVSGTTTTKPYLSTTSVSGASLYFPSASSGLYNIAVLPRVADNVNIAGLQIRAQMRAAAANPTLYVGVMTNPLDYSTFVIVDSLNVPSTTFTEVSANLTSYTGTGRYIAFVNKSNAVRYLDNLSIDLIPACDNTSDILVQDASATEATVTWTGNPDANGYQLVLVPCNSAFSAGTAVTVYDTTYTFNNLTTATCYNVYLRHVCSNGYSNYVYAGFSTPCEGISTLPYTENFDSYTGTTSTTVNNLPDCWNYFNESTTYTGYPIVYSGSSYAASGSNSLRFYTYSTTAYTEQFAILPPIDGTLFPISDLQMTFDMRKFSTTYNLAQVVVGVITNPYDTSTFVAIDTIDQTSTEYAGFQVFFSGYQGAGGRIALKATKLTTYNQPCIDNIVIAEANPCKPVMNITATDIQTDNITIGWTPRGHEDTWHVIYRELYDTTWAAGASSAPTFTADNLTPNTTYVFGVSADCESEASDTMYAYFTTECLPTPIPWTESFDNLTANTSSATNVLPSCWTYINNGSNATYAGCPSTYNSSSYANSGTNSVKFYSSTGVTYDDQYLVLPEVDTTATPINTLMVTFQARSYTTSYGLLLKVGVLTNAGDPSTFTVVDSFNVSETTYGSYSAYFTGYTGYGSRIAIMMPALGTTQHGYIDDINLKLAPNCMAVSDLNLSDVTTSSMTLSWTPGGSESSWIVRYRSENETSFTTVTVTDTFYTLNNLDANTLYAFSVQANCGDALSTNSEFVSTRTLCNPTSLPFFENFDGIAAGTSGATNNLPNCWNYYNANTTSTYAGYPVVYNSSTYANSGTNSLRFYTYTSSSYSDEYAILPEFDVPLNTLKMSFAARAYSTSSTYNTRFVVGVINGNDATTFQSIDTVDVFGTTYSDFTIFFDQFQGTGGRIAIKVPQISSANYNCGYIDDISVMVNTCLTPSQLTATSLTETTADLTWTPGGSETEWELLYKAATDDEWSQTTTVSGTPAHQLTGLTNNTTYEVRLRALCGTNDFSPWYEGSFTQNWIDTTPQIEPCDIPSDLTVTAVGNHSLTLSWSNSTGAQQWNIRYRKAGTNPWSSATSSTNSYQIMGLDGLTAYEIQVQAVCEDTTSNWSPSVSGITTNVGIDDFDLNVTLAPNPAKEYIDIRLSDDNTVIQEVEVYDIYGKLIRTTNVQGNPARLDVSTLSDGMYFVRITSDKGTSTKNFIKK